MIEKIDDLPRCAGFSEQSRAPVKRVAVLMSGFPEEFRQWVTTDPKTATRILDLIDSCLTTPFAGIGKPESLKYLGPDIWSRRVTGDHRLVYVVKHEQIDFLMCRYHYD
ncbi:MAG: Txe/YoeB family addiction module toxin [Bacteroidota bacterium]